MKTKKNVQSFVFAKTCVKLFNINVIYTELGHRCWGDKKLIGPSKTDALLTLIQQFLQDIPQHHFYAVGQIEITN